MLLLSLLVETGQLPGAGLTQADKTCIQLNFYLEILKGAIKLLFGDSQGIKLLFGDSQKGAPGFQVCLPLNTTLLSMYRCHILPHSSIELLHVFYTTWLSEDYMYIYSEISLLWTPLGRP